MENIRIPHDRTSILSETNIHIPRTLLVPLFAAASLYLSSIEYLLPRPVPFFRFGLANIAILLTLRTFTLRDLCILVMLKVLGLGILNGTIASYVFMFSLLGSLSGLMVMYVISRMNTTHISLVGISVGGAMGSNIVQTLCAVFYIFGRNAWIIAPYLFMLGIISGYVIGVIAQYFASTSQFLPKLLHTYTASDPLIDMPQRYTHSSLKKESFVTAPTMLLMCGIGTSIAYVASTSLTGRVIQVLVFFIVARSVKRIKVLYFCMLIASVTCFALLIPDGKVLISFRSFALTLGALQNGLFRSLTLCGYVFLSLWCISPQLHIPGRLGAMLTKTLAFFYLFLEHLATYKQNTAYVSTKHKVSFTDYIDNAIKQVTYIYAQSHEAEYKHNNTQEDLEKVQKNWHKSGHTVSWRYGIISMIITYATLIIFQ